MPKSILVADDSHTMRKVIGLVLASEEITLTMVDNGMDAVNRAKEMRPDAVLIDCMMPGKNGYEVCEMLKSDPQTAGIPVMLLAGAAGAVEPFDEGRAKSVRADTHMPKPFESQQFIDRVRGLVGMAPAVPVTQGYGTISQGPAKSSAPAAHAVPAPVPSQPRPMPGPAGVPPPSGMRPSGVPGAPGPGMPRPPMQGMPPGGAPMGRPPMQGGMPLGTQPGMPMQGRPGMPGPGLAPQGMPMQGRPGMLMQGRPGMPMQGRPGMPGPGMVPQGMPMQGRPMQGGVPMGSQAGFPRPPGVAGLPGAGQPGAGMPGQVRRDPFGMPPAGQPMARPADGGEAMLRDALSKASKEVIEKIAWEVVPQLAETIIREELDRLIKDREAKH